MPIHGAQVDTRAQRKDVPRDCASAQRVGGHTTKRDTKGNTMTTVLQKVTVGPDWKDENHSVTVVHETWDYTTPDGFYHREGAHRVTATHTLSGRAWSGRSYKGRARTFKGETAWMSAERLFDDIITEVRFSR